MNAGKPQKVRPIDPSRPARRESSAERRLRRARERQPYDPTAIETSEVFDSPPLPEGDDVMLDGAGVEAAASAGAEMEQAGDTTSSADVEHAGGAPSAGVEQSGIVAPEEIDPGAHTKTET